MQIKIRTRAISPAFILISVAILQLALLAFSLPLSDLFTGKFSYHIDNPYHVYQLELGKALLRQGQLIGFDPLLGAGHLGGMNDNVSARIPVFMAALLPASMPSGTVYSLYIMLCALSAPLAVPWMAAILGWPRRHQVIAAALGLAFWWIGALHWYHSAGMASFVTGCYLGLPYAAWTWQLCSAQRRPTMRLFTAGVLGGLGMWLHPLFPVLVGVLFVGFFVWSSGHAATVAQICLRGASLGAIALAVNAPWLIAMLGSHDIGANPLLLHPFQKRVGLMVALQPALGTWGHDSMGTFLNPLVILACCMGLFWIGGEQRRRMLPFVFAGVLLLAFAAFGAVSASLGSLQPNRFLAPAFLLLALAAAYCCGEIADRLKSAPPPWIRWGGLAVVSLLSLYTAREMVREAMPGPHGHYAKAPPELTGPAPMVAALEAWISANTSADGRIVFETSLGRVHGGGHVAGLLALHTQRELIGAAYPYSLPVVSFWDHVAFGRPIGEVSAAGLMSGFDLYNVGWVVAHSAQLKQAMQAVPAATTVAHIGVVEIFRIARPLSYVAVGSARIAGRGFNRLDVAGASGPELVLKYHWLPKLVASPAANIQPVQMAPGFPAFIRVINPPPNFTLSRAP